MHNEVVNEPPSTLSQGKSALDLELEESSAKLMRCASAPNVVKEPKESSINSMRRASAPSVFRESEEPPRPIPPPPSTCWDIMSEYEKVMSNLSDSIKQAKAEAEEMDAKCDELGSQYEKLQATDKEFMEYRELVELDWEDLKSVVATMATYVS